MEIVEHAADLPELTLLEEQGEVRLRKPLAKGIELFDALAVAAHEVAVAEPGSKWVPFWVPQAGTNPHPQPYLADLNGRGERIRTSDPLVPNQIKAPVEIC